MKKSFSIFSTLVLLFITAITNPLLGQSAESMQKPLLGQPGIMITLVLIAIPIILGALLA